VVEFMDTELWHVSGAVKDNFFSTSYDAKLTVPFKSGPACEIITLATNAACAFVAHVDMGLLSANAAESASPLTIAAAPARKARPAGTGNAQSAPAAAKRSRTTEPESVAATKARPALKVTVDGDLVSTKGLQDLLGRLGEHHDRCGKDQWSISHKRADCVEPPCNRAHKGFGQPAGK
jgi:hypothetical protein